MKVLVTGASGFIGNRIAEFLNESGVEVTGVLHTDRGVVYPFRTIIQNLEEKIEAYDNYDVIVHCAGLKPRRKTESASFTHYDIMKYKNANVDAMENIVLYAQKMGVSRIIYTSSIAIYGDIRSEDLDEDSDIVNPDEYGATKYMAERILEDSGIECISLRCPGVIGKEASGIWFTNAINKIKNNEELTIYTPDFKTSNFVWIDDLTEFVYLLILKKKLEYNCVVIGSETTTTIRKMVTKMINLTHSQSVVKEEEGIRKPFCIIPSKAISMGFKSCDPLDIVEKYLREMDR